MITKKAFNEWLEDPVTIRVFETLGEERRALNECLLHAVPNYQSKENCLMVTGRSTGAINAIDLMLKINYECIQTEEEEEAENNE